MKTKDITQGALCTAIYALLLLVNQQSALTLETSMPWLFVLPALVFTAKAGPAAGAMASLAMGLETFLFGGFTTWFYSWSSLVTGFVTGWCIFAGLSSFWQLVSLFVCQFAGNMAIVLLWAGLFGMEWDAEFAWLQSIAPWLDMTAFLVIVNGILSLMTAVCIHLLGYLLMTRLKIPCPPLKKVTEIRPSRPLGIAFAVTMAVFILVPDMVVWNVEWKNLLLPVLTGLFLYMDYCGTVWLMDRCVRKGRRSWAPVVILGAFVPGLNLVWAGLGTAYALRRTTI